MRELLIHFAEDFTGYTLFGTFLFFFVWIWLYGKRTKKRIQRPDDPWDERGRYFWIGLLLCMLIPLRGIGIAGLLADMFRDATIIIVILLISYPVLAILFFLSLCRIYFFQRYGLYYTKISLLSVVIFISLVPISSFIFCIIMTGELEKISSVTIHSIEYYKNINSFEQKIISLQILPDLIFVSIVVLPWLHYFCFSKKINKVWAYIDREYDNFQEGDNVLPDYVLE